MSGKVVIVGYSSHAYVVADAAYAMGMSLTHYCDIKKTKLNLFQLEYLGFEGDENFIGWHGDYRFILGVGNNEIRNKTGLKVLTNNKQLLNVIHPSASYSKYTEMGRGNFISRQVSVNALSKIGNFCILNTACIIEHECQIGDAVHIAPGAVLSGNVVVGDLSFIGANAVIKQGVKIGSNVIIGAGSVILNDVLDNSTIVGNPGRKL